ncbi:MULTISPECIES: folylpolyglutamate synthase/dihydrofolate synthase family protein [Spirulina sp. CCY15215]|uniref:bifunctional folylpolyglutamate synthase/dihydrofolate synthase n=1 Tax=Spirulina sp. CCY15215 TaxID=2767591 RepID=UPI001950E723|nr:folylpolyglutamate synthase/dihydrofolate synthase family protein [Spirulina major]
MTINELLNPWQKFGINLGLERIEFLLNRLGNPHHCVPIAHIAGTNGKGSVCAYLSATLTVAGYKVGRYTSPHLVSWTERICINEREIESQQLEAIVKEVIAAIAPEFPPTQFEIFTAATWLYFARENVDIAIMEVGLGGRLDATNVCDSPLVTIITSLSREHWQILGDTVAEIAREKAGILKPNCPAIIGQLPREAEPVIKERIQTLNCPSIWVKPAERIAENRAKSNKIEYELPLLGDVQLMNSAIAIAALQVLQQKGWHISQASIQIGIAQTRWLGRLQWTQWKQQKILIDGAHNPAAAQMLRQYVETLNTPIAWVIGILASKDQKGILAALLRPGDRLYLVPVPHQDYTEPKQLETLAKQICPELLFCQTYFDLFPALNEAITTDYGVVLGGSLYLVGYYLQKMRSHRDASSINTY